MEPPDQLGDQLGQLLSSLRADGAVDSEGRFTLDRDQARAKMQKFQLVDARRYVLELVQAAVARGASTIEFEIDADDMRMRFDGEVFTHAEIDDLYGSLFSAGDTPALRGVRQLALALNAALGMDPKHIELRSGAVELRMVPGASDQIVARDPGLSSTAIHVRQRLRPRVFVDFFNNLRGRLTEERCLRHGCVHASVAITLNGERISFGHECGSAPDEGDDLYMCLPFEGPDFRGTLRIQKHSGAGTLRLCKDEVWIDSRELFGRGSKLLAVVKGDALRKDVSQARIVQDAAVVRIIAAARGARWTALRAAAERSKLPELRVLEPLTRVHLLNHATLAELDGHRDARALSARLAWPDCRDPVRRVSLRILVELALAGEVPRYARAAYPELAADGDPGPPIMLIDPDSDDIEALSRTLGVELVCADVELSRQRRRFVGRQAWRERVGQPTLPDHLSFAARGPVTAELHSGPVRGEIGIDARVLASPDMRAPLHLFMYKDGALLGQAEVNITLPGLWLALDAGFEPNDDYSDARRDAAFIQIFLRGFAALSEPLASLLQRVTGHVNEPGVRGLVKRWLIALTDPKSQVALLTRAGADVAPGFFAPVAELLLDLFEGPLAQLLLFEGLVGPRRSLAQLHELTVLPYVTARPEDPRLVAADVLLLGPGDRKLLRAVFGDRLREWDAAFKRRELAFHDRKIQGLDARRRAFEAGLVDAGEQRERWIVELPEGPTRGFVVQLGVRSADKGRPSAQVEVRHQDRRLCSVELDGGVGRVVAVVEHPRLCPSPTWDDVVRDAAFDEVMTAVRRASEQLFARVCQSFASHPPELRRELASQLVHQAARDPQRRALADELELLDTVDGHTLSLAGAAAVIAAHGELAYVDAGAAPVSDPPVVLADAATLADLRALFGDVLVDGSVRVRHQQVSAVLERRPRLTTATLDPGKTLVRVALPGHDGQRGELGIASDRSEPTLELRLGAAGRELGVVHDRQQIHVPLDGVVIDENLPLDAEGEVDTRAKRVRVLVRHCRRRIPDLIVSLCERWPQLPEHDQARAWAVLVAQLRGEANQERRAAREQAYVAAAAVRGFRDVLGRRHSLAALVRAARRRPLDVLVDPRFRGLTLDLAQLDRPVVLVGPDELECLRAHVSVDAIDDRWDAELAALRSFAAATPVVWPDLQAVALGSRTATVAGGLSCTLWLPRDASVFQADAPEWVFARAERELDRRRVFTSLPSAGIVTGDGLIHRGGAVELDERQRSSLARQLVIMYAELAEAIANDRVAKPDHERALEYLAWADHHLAEAGAAELRGLGERYTALRRALDRVVPPTLRRALEQRFAPPPPAAKPKPKPKPRAPSPPPEQRLFAAVYEQLAHWARASHYVLLTSMSLEPRGAGVIARSERSGLVFNADHPIIIRLLAQQPHDPFDLAFVIAAVYSLLDDEAQDQRSFVAQLAESLALSVRADHRNPQPRSSSSG